MPPPRNKRKKQNININIKTIIITRMKKLITLLLVLTGMVLTANATEYTVYFKPGNTWSSNCSYYQLNMKKKTGDSQYKAVTMSQVGTTGIYSATYESDYDDYIQFLGKKSDDSQFGYSGNFSVPTSNLYVEKNNDWHSTWEAGTTGMVVLTPATKSWTVSGYTKAGVYIQALDPNFTDANSESGKTLTSNGDFTYSRTVTGNYLPSGEYGFKVNDGGSLWYGSNESAWNYACPITGISTSAAGVYDITYTFNFITGACTATATKMSDAVLTEKYIIAGDGAILNAHNWDTSGSYNVLDIDGTTGTLTYNNVSLDAGNYEFKAAKLLLNNGTKYKTIWCGSDNSNWNFTRPSSIYNLTFTCNTSDLSSSLTPTEVDGYFLIGGTTGEGWTLGQRLTESDGVYSAEITDKNYRFGIISNESLNSITDNTPKSWNNLIRPEGSEDTNITWANSPSSNTINTNNNQGWKIPASGDNFPADVTVAISYTPGTGKWAVSPYIMRTLPAAAEGYATFSTTVDVQADSRLTPKYASAVSAGAITWAEFTDRKIAKNEGALLTGGNAGWGYQFFPATSVTAPATNLMKPIASKMKLDQSTDGVTTYFILSKKDVLGFYKVNDSGSWCNAGTAYLQVANGQISARGFFLFDDDSNTTAIEAVKKEQKMNGEYYNLAGQRVAQPTKGLYIVNGKKVIVK